MRGCLAVNSIQSYQTLIKTLVKPKLDMHAGRGLSKDYSWYDLGEDARSGDGVITITPSVVLPMRHLVTCGSSMHQYSLMCRY